MIVFLLLSIPVIKKPISPAAKIARTREIHSILNLSLAFDIPDAEIIPKTRSAVIEWRALT